MTDQKAKEMDELARHVKPLLGLLLRRGVSRMDAGDILHDAFLKVFSRRDTLPESLEQRKAILFSEVKLRMLAYFTEQNRACDRAANAYELAEFMGLNQQREMSGVLEARQQLEYILPHISADQYEVFTTKVLDEMTIREVADRLGMKPNTAKSHWLRALKTLEEKLEKIEQRGGRGLIVFLVIASILGLARNASAMVELLKRFFRAIRQAHVHHLAGVATAGMIMLSPPNSGASVHDVSSSSRHEISANASGEIKPDSEISGQNSTVVTPSVHDAPSRAVPLVTSQQNAPKKSAKKSVPPDYLISAAMAALRGGQPERALVLLDQYGATNAKAANSGVVKTLRADAQAAMAGR